MGSPSRMRNCLGCGPAIRVPSPAAGRITKTCIRVGVYNEAATCGGQSLAHRLQERKNVPQGLMLLLDGFSLELDRRGRFGRNAVERKRHGVLSRLEHMPGLRRGGILILSRCGGAE